MRPVDNEQRDAIEARVINGTHHLPPLPTLSLSFPTPSPSSTSCCSRIEHSWMTARLSDDFNNCTLVFGPNDPRPSLQRIWESREPRRLGAKLMRNSRRYLFELRVGRFEGGRFRKWCSRPLLWRPLLETSYFERRQITSATTLSKERLAHSQVRLYSCERRPTSNDVCEIFQAHLIVLPPV